MSNQLASKGSTIDRLEVELDIFRGTSEGVCPLQDKISRFKEGYELMSDIEEKEQEVIRREAKEDDESELGHSRMEITDVIHGDKHYVDYNPFDHDDVQAVLAEKDDKIRELDGQVQELVKYVNSHNMQDHPEYLKLKAQNDQLVLENAELMETNRRLMKENPGATFKPATSFGGSVGQ